MITKGLDFDNVSLVGILDADSMLNFPYFRAHERAFQLMMQVSGRAGRKNKQGKVIIQTSNPGHKIIQFVLKNDIEGYFAGQLKERKEFRYPPFYRIIEITLKHKKTETLDTASEYLKKILYSDFGGMVLGPQSPLISKVQNWYLKQFIIKIGKDKPLIELKSRITNYIHNLRSQTLFSSLQVVIDVDPV